MKPQLWVVEGGGKVIKADSISGRFAPSDATDQFGDWIPPAICLTTFLFSILSANGSDQVLPVDFFKNALERKIPRKDFKFHLRTWLMDYKLRMAALERYNYNTCFL